MRSVPPYMCGGTLSARAYLRDAQPVPAWSNHGDDTNRTLRASLEVGLNERALDRPDDGSW